MADKKHILVLDLGLERTSSTVSFMGVQLVLQRIGCGGDPEKARALIGEYDGRVDAIGLENMPAELQLGSARCMHEAGAALKQAAQVTPVVDGSGVRAGLER